MSGLMKRFFTVLIDKLTKNLIIFWESQLHYQRNTGNY